MNFTIASPQVAQKRSYLAPQKKRESERKRIYTLGNFLIPLRWQLRSFIRGKPAGGKIRRRWRRRRRRWIVRREVISVAARWDLHNERALARERGRSLWPETRRIIRGGAPGGAHAWARPELCSIKIVPCIVPNTVGVDFEFSYSPEPWAALQAALSLGGLWVILGGSLGELKKKHEGSNRWRFRWGFRAFSCDAHACMQYLISDGNCISLFEILWNAISFLTTTSKVGPDILGMNGKCSGSKVMKFKVVKGKVHVQN